MPNWYDFPADGRLIAKWLVIKRLLHYSINSLSKPGSYPGFIRGWWLMFSDDLCDFLIDLVSDRFGLVFLIIFRIS